MRSANYRAAAAEPQQASSEEQQQPQSQPANIVIEKELPKLVIERSCEFMTVRYALIGGILIIFGLNLISIPWTFDVARELLREVNDTNTWEVTVTESVVGSVVALTVLLNISYLLYGLLAVYKESLALNCIFLLFVTICFVISFLNYTKLLFTLKMITDVILGSLLFIYVIMIKRSNDKFWRKYYETTCDPSCPQCVANMTSTTISVPAASR